ncbi:MAG TPA: DUF5671 domain-containing protein [Anaerolineales bacterium]|nr:DUF5671 domain-containing protein [Anaerolineales bacterium]
MQTIRRLYLYAVALVSLETVLWGTIGLVRSIFEGEAIGDSAARLAGALSLILVGIPVFLVHWWLAQRGAQREIEERSTRLRALFLYGASLGTLVPVFQNLLALISRTLILIFGGRPGQAMFGGDQSLSDNLIAILLNGVVALYIYSVLRADWRLPLQGEAFSETRRLYRYFLMLYGLAMVVFGVQQVVQYTLVIWQAVGQAAIGVLANGLALLVVGAPLWTWLWRLIQHSLAEASEARSALRLFILYVLSFISVVSVLSSAGLVIYWLLRLVLGEQMAVSLFLSEISTPLSVGLSFGTVWAYFGRTLGVEMGAVADETRRAGLRRLYHYILALLGLGAVFIGLYMLLAFILDLTLGEAPVWGSALRNNLAAALATLLAGLPIWLVNWRQMALEAAREGEQGDHARRSVLRKGYLYLALFAGVMGVMFASGALLYQFLRAWLGDPVDNLALMAAQQAKTILLFAILLAYHWRALRADNRLAEHSLAKLHAQFPVLILAPDEPEFGNLLAGALEREVLGLPVAVHPYSQGAPDVTLSAARAVILPAELLATPPEAVHLWLQTFSGTRLVVPSPAQGWHWLFGSERPLAAQVRQTARVVRHLAEGETIPAPRESSPWMIVLYIMAGLLGLEILLAIFSLFASLIFE